MTFGEPVWFWGFALFPLLIALFFHNERLRTRALQKLVASRLLPRLAGSASVTKRRLRFLLLLLGLACVIVSMARPRWGFTFQERKTSGRDVIIAIDTSRSMLANDLAPNRLTRAKLAAADLIGQLPGDRVGLIAFAGTAFLQAPLTADHSAVLGALHEIDTEIIPRGGTNIAAAIRTAVEAFGKGESDNRALIVVTDGEELDADGIEAAKEQKEIARIYTVGVGSLDGTVIALPGSGGNAYVTDPQGQIVKSKLDEERLQTIANAGGGFYLHLENGPTEMRQLAREGIGAMSENEISADVTRQPIERYQWPLGTGMALLCLSMLIGERRRGSGAQLPRAAATSAACFAVLFFSTIPVKADSPRDLYEGGRYSEAQKAYEELLRKNPESDRLAFNQGAAAYKNRDFNTALQAFGKALTTKDPELRARAEYNLGNTLFQQALGGKKGPDIKGLEGALEHFGEARKLEPNNEDANYNYEATRGLIEQLKKQQEQQQQQDKEEKKEDKQDREKQDKDKEKQEQQKSGDQKDQEKKDGQQDQQQSPDKSGQKEDKKEGQSEQQQQEGQPDQKDQQGEGKQDKDQEKPGQAGQKPDEQKQKSQDANKEQEGKEGEQPEEGQGEQPQNRKLEGDLKNNPAPGQEGEQSDEQREAAEEALAAAEGRMTESQAKALLDSLKNDDARVQLFDPRENRRRERPLRDW